MAERTAAASRISVRYRMIFATDVQPSPAAPTTCVSLASINSAWSRMLDGNAASEADIGCPWYTGFGLIPDRKWRPEGPVTFTAEPSWPAMVFALLMDMSDSLIGRALGGDY